MARPTEYKEEYIGKVQEYLDERQDEEYIHEDKESFVVTRVKLPTIEGFALFIGVNKSSLYEWEKKYPEFSDALEEIRQEQHQRLIDNGLKGDYNPTIAKLILSSNHGYKEKTDVTSDEKPINAISVTIKSNDNTEPRSE